MNKKKPIILICCIVGFIIVLIGLLFFSMYLNYRLADIISQICIILICVLISTIIYIASYKIFKGNLANKEKLDSAATDKYYQWLTKVVGIDISNTNLSGENSDGTPSHSDSNDDKTQFLKTAGSTTSTSKKSQSEIILGLLTANLAEINGYYKLSRRQADKSFFMASLIGMLGFCLLAAAVVMAIIYRDAIYISIISALSGVLVDSISAFFLFLYKKSLSQLNHYHMQLRESEKYLSAVMLLDKVSNENKDKMIDKLIESQINRPADSTEK